MFRTEFDHHHEVISVHAAYSTLPCWNYIKIMSCLYMLRVQKLPPDDEHLSVQKRVEGSLKW
jgi:hypothetical protein